MDLFSPDLHHMWPSFDDIINYWRAKKHHTANERLSPLLLSISASWLKANSNENE